MRLILQIFFILILPPACNKHLQTEKNDNPQGYADSQVVGNWKVTAVTSNVAYDWDGNGIKETNVFSTWTNCQKDNLYIFSGDKSGSFKTNCTTTEQGSWFINNTQSLVYSATMLGTESEKFVSMTNQEFKTSKDIILSNGQSATLTKTWTRQ